jgi:hypothetical protein
MKVEVLKIKAKLEEISEAHRSNCKKWIVGLDSRLSEINHHNIYCDALDAAYQTFCKESNVPYEPLKREQVI